MKFITPLQITSHLCNLDSPSEYQITFQDPASVYMEGVLLFNNTLMLLIVCISIVVGWLLTVTLLTTTESVKTSSSSNFAHSNRLEIGWTTTPALTLLVLSSPSFALLFSMDEVADPNMTLKIYGHQWYWSYELSDYNSCLLIKNIRYYAYMLQEENLMENGRIIDFRNLGTTNRVVLPTNTHIRLLVTSVDVLHSWAVPSLGIKVDACPGRLNLVNLFLKRVGLFYGQCSEICGVNHGFMPISILAINSVKFSRLLQPILQNM